MGMIDRTYPSVFERKKKYREARKKDKAKSYAGGPGRRRMKTTRRSGMPPRLPPKPPTGPFPVTPYRGGVPQEYTKSRALVPYRGGAMKGGGSVTKPPGGMVKTSKPSTAKFGKFPQFPYKVGRLGRNLIRGGILGGIGAAVYNMWPRSVGEGSDTNVAMQGYPGVGGARPMPDRKMEIMARPKVTARPKAKAPKRPTKKKTMRPSPRVKAPTPKARQAPMKASAPQASSGLQKWGYAAAGLAGGLLLSKALGGGKDEQNTNINFYPMANLPRRFPRRPRY